jgi:formamidopyrimidine-DNA glycosylase
MPELPEVETVRRGLAPYIVGKTIRDVEVLDARSLKKDSVKHFKSTLAQRRITGIERRGKFLWLILDNSPNVVVVHLGMSGQVLLEPHSSQMHSHVRINIALKNASREIRFRDQRLFGGLHLDTLQGDIPASVSHIAPDFFDTRFDLDSVLKTLSKRTAGIKSLLLNQNIISGVGNIYADEALWLAKVHYLTPGNRLSKSRLETLLLSAQEVMAKAIKAGGTSFDDLYVNVNGESGWFELELNAYGREDEPCSRCGRLIVREAWSNRSSYRCPRCQPKPRTAR